MELSRRSIHYYETVLDATAVHGESADIIVPDLFPDILRIVDAEGCACLKEKHVRDGKAEVAGVVRAGVLYMPEGEEGIQRLDLTIPFSHMFEGGNMLADPVELFARVELLSVEARTMNPRKVQVEVSVYIGVTAYSPADWTLCDAIQTDAEASLEILQQTHTAYMTVAVKSKSFSVADELEISGSRPPVSDILRADVQLSTQEIKQIGSKLVFKSTAALRMLYRGEHPSEIAVFEQELPFSQIVEMEGLEDGCDGKVELQLSGLEMEPRAAAMGGEARGVGVTLHVTAQAQAFRECPLDCVTDLYSTTYAVTPMFRSFSVTKLLDRGAKRQSVRDTVNVSAQSILDTKVSLSPVSVQKNDEGHLFMLEAMAKVLYLDEEGEYQSASGRMSVSMPVDLPAGATARVSAALAGEIAAGATSEGIEVRFGVEFDYTIAMMEPLSVVDGLQGDWETPKDISGQPSVVLRRFAGGEALWDLSKKYNTTRDDILLSNHLAEEQELAAGSLLLIPRKR